MRVNRPNVLVAKDPHRMAGVVRVQYEYIAARSMNGLPRDVDLPIGTPV
jgi:hypothetical protein